MVIKIIMLIAFFAVMIGVGFACRKASTDVDGFVLGGRSVGPWLSAFAYGTSYFSAVIFIGYAGQFGWNFGIASTWIGIGNAIIGSLLAWVILGRRTRLITNKLNTKTMPEFFEKRFNSKFLKVSAAIIVFVFLIPYTASLYNGLSRLFTMAFPGIDYTVCVFVMALLTGIYVILGGYLATAVNDFIQGIIMLIGIIAVIAAVLNSNGGFMNALDSLGKVTDTTVSTTPGIFASFFGPDPFGLFSVIILTSLGTWGLPQMVQKFYAIKDERSILKGTVISTLFAVVIAGGCYFLGGFGRLYDIDVKTNGFDSIIPTMLSNLNNDLIIGLVVILVLSASMSTLSSLVLTSSSTLTLDLLHGDRMTEKKQVGIMRILIVVFIAISALIAVYQLKSTNESVKYIAQLMGVSWGALAGAFLAPFIYGLYWKRTTKYGCIASFIFGVGIMLAEMFFKSSFPIWLQSPIKCGAFAMLAGLVIVPVVSLLTPKPDQNKVSEMFSCYEETVVVHKKTVLSDD